MHLSSETRSDGVHYITPDNTPVARISWNSRQTLWVVLLYSAPAGFSDHIAFHSLAAAEHYVLAAALELTPEGDGNGKETGP